MRTVIEAQDVSLHYRIARNPTRSFKEFAVMALKRQVTHQTLPALEGVSFTARSGELLAVIGANGAGKSTLMKVLARILPPTGGRVIVRGLIAPMIELGAGFNPELTGAENVVLYGTLLGREPSLMKQRLPAIAQWAELEDFMDVPLRSYSSGMLARLGFAVATDVAPSVLILDEVMAVGDEAFRRKSAGRIAELKERGACLVFVSHALDVVRATADRVLWLDQGAARMLGEPKAVVDAYQQATKT